MKQTATDAYIGHQITIAQQIAELQQLVQAYQDNTPADGVHWGHAGDLGHVSELLQDAIDFLGNHEAR